MNVLRPKFASGVSSWLSMFAVALSVGLSFQSTSPTPSSRQEMFLLGCGVGLLAGLGLKRRSQFAPAAVVVLAGCYVLAIRGKDSILTLNDPLIWAWVPLTAIALLAPARSTVSSLQGRRVALARLSGVIAVVGLSFALVGAGVFRSSSAPESTASGQDDEAGKGQGANDPLAVQASLDMTRRPNLTEKIVFTVETDTPSFWRTATFDVWDGSSWSRSENGLNAEYSTSPTEKNLGPIIRSSQRFELEVDARALPVAPTVLSTSLNSNEAQFIAGRDLVALEALGAGSIYEVESAVLAPTEELLSGAEGDIPDAIVEQYAQTPFASDRVQQLAASLSAPSDSTWEKVRAIEAWLGNNTEYSINAPTSDQGSDVVNDFLFESQLGWCEQVASSMVVLLRLQGVPARLVAGYTPGQRSNLDGRLIVRESDAHAWTEVWVPNVGWVPIDPTASVPLGGDRTSEGRPLDLKLVGFILVGLLLISLSVGPLRRLFARIGSRSRQKRFKNDLPVGWIAETETVLDDLGETTGRQRLANESAAAFCVALSEILNEPDLVVIGSALDRARYSADDSSVLNLDAEFLVVALEHATEKAKVPLGTPA